MRKYADPDKIFKKEVAVSLLDEFSPGFARPIFNLEAASVCVSQPGSPKEFVGFGDLWISALDDIRRLSVKESQSDYVAPFRSQRMGLSNSGTALRL